MKKRLILYYIAGALTLAGCDDLFEPAIENHMRVEQMYGDQDYMMGLLQAAYGRMPGYYDNSEYATDDAVTNDMSNGFLQMATGGWTNTTSTGLSRWNDCYNAIQYIHLYLLHEGNVTWSEDEEMHALFKQRLEGEAYGLRGMFYFYLLRAYAGYSADGELLGVPLILEYQTAQSDFNQPRATFQACVEQINKDLRKAEELLPDEYNDESAVPDKFKNLTSDISKFNNVMGSKARLLFNGQIARAFRARTALLAASPLFQDASNTTTWEDAANAAAEVLDYNGGLGGLAENGVTYYSADITKSIKDGINPKEILWRENYTGDASDSWESDHFPPSLYGSGRMNPSQNLVDAFPMANGYPIDANEAGYSESSPYTNRDPRLAQYILYNGAVIAEKNNKTMNIVSSSSDGINVTEERSTRTGYYMKKRLRMDVNCNPASESPQPHYTPRIRYTEMYLAYAEAANEAWGPKGNGGHGYSAYDVIKDIRKRAGLGQGDGSSKTDPYLERCANSQDQMRELIRNERRIELCFESFRFWDIRRWKLDMNEPVEGLQYTGTGYQRFQVENRSYEDYMYYCPIPNSEVLKYNNLKQNRGWE